MQKRSEHLDKNQFLQAPKLIRNRRALRVETTLGRMMVVTRTSRLTDRSPVYVHSSSLQISWGEAVS